MSRKNPPAALSGKTITVLTAFVLAGCVFVGIKDGLLSFTAGPILATLDPDTLYVPPAKVIVKVADGEAAVR